MRDFFSAIRDFSKEYPAWAAVVGGVLFILLVLLILALRPPSPLKTVQIYIDRLNVRDCQGAFRLVSEERKRIDNNLETQSDFARMYCSQMDESFVKMFVSPDEAEVSAAGNRAEVSYQLCVLPKGFVRRECTRQEASLIRESGRWKIVFLDIPGWSTPHDFNFERREDLVPDHSKYKYNVPPVNNRGGTKKKKETER